MLVSTGLYTIMSGVIESVPIELYLSTMEHMLHKLGGMFELKESVNKTLSY